MITKYYIRKQRKRMNMLFAHVPPYRTRSEKEMKEILHRWKVVAYKRRLEDEISHPIQLLALPQYVQESRRRDLWKFIINKCQELLP